VKSLRDRALSLIDRSRLSPAEKESARQLVRSSLRIFPTPKPDSKLALGTSKFGGASDVPVPQGLGFVAQINLAYVAERGLEDLPPAGLLSFFFDLDEEPFGFDPTIDSCRVLYTPPGAPLSRAPADDGLSPCALTFHENIGLPPLDSSDVKEILRDFGPGADGYLSLSASLRDLGSDGATAHRLGGHPDPIQGDMQLEAQLVANGIDCGSFTGHRDPRVAALRAGARDWRLLLQIDSDDAIEWSFGDGGRLYFWIRHQDLLARRFDRVRAILQSH
jgi:uncharacterized protein YwqG